MSAQSSSRANLALLFILATVTLDAIGIGLIFPVMPDLMESVTHGTLSQAAMWGGVLATSYAVSYTHLDVYKRQGSICAHGR